MTFEEMTAIAKRENNSKRGFLLVNRFQAKHIPSDPEITLDLFSRLGKKLRYRYRNEKRDHMLVIGFAETATAIGACAAAQLGALYIQTTRETIPGAQYLYFSEEHSHAVNQQVVRSGLDALIKSGQRPFLKRIVFVDDEITTGKTILNIIDVLKKEYGDNIKFTAASLINGMSAENERIYRENGIDIICLFRTDNAGFEEKAAALKADGEYSEPPFTAPEADIHSFTLTNAVPDARHVVPAREYRQKCRYVCRRLIPCFDGCGKDVLVLGTEEFMYPAVIMADELKKEGINAVSCSTTRSPIAVSRDESYPLHSRLALPSLYDPSRITYIYDPKKYSSVIILTDAADPAEKAMNALINALAGAGNDKIFLVTL